MKLKALALHNYRNYEDLQFLCKDGIHILSGKNAQGKTNFLEAIYYISTTRSHRTIRDSDLIRNNEEAFFIKATIEKKGKKEDVKITVNERGKNLFIYDKAILKVSNFIQEFNAVMFCPDDLLLFHASPRFRRRFIDLEIGKISKKYVDTLYKAQKLLKERNAYLKQGKIDEAYIEVLTDQMIDLQVIIMKQRYYFLNHLLKRTSIFYQKFTKDQTSIDIQYLSCIPYIDDLETMRKLLKEKYEKSWDKDILWKQTNFGIHKEDYAFLLDDKDVDTYASQGQKRSILLAIKIGMIEIIKELIDEYPVLLLDDVFSELDASRRMKLLQELPKDLQIFISTTDYHEYINLTKDALISFYQVDEGKIIVV